MFSNSLGCGRALRVHVPPMPALFGDAGWDKINSTVLSTSNCGNPSLRHFGFGPTSGDGFGIGYIIKDESIAICASSKHRQTGRFVHTLETYLLEIRKLLRATQRRRPAPTISAGVSEVESAERPGMCEGPKSRGRLIRPDRLVDRRVETPTADTGEVDDDGMGGCMFTFTLNNHSVSFVLMEY